MSSCSEQKCQENYLKMKALRKCLKEEHETNQVLNERVKELEITVQSKEDTLESLQMNNQRLVLRIETLQSKEQPQAKAQGNSGWGSTLFGSSTAQLTEEIEKLKGDLEVAQEELEAKMAENQHVHELNFDNKRKLDNMVDTMKDQEKVHEDKIAELEAFLSEKDGENKRLDSELNSEKTLKESLEEQRSNLMKQYESEKTTWQDTREKIEHKLNRQQGLFRERIPFDPFGQAQLSILNANKSDCKTRDKQVEIIQSLKSVVDPTSAQSLGQGFESLFTALKNLSDGSMPVFNNEFGQDGDDLGDPAFSNSLLNQSVKQFTIYLERIIDLIGKLEESTPVFFMCLFKVLELALQGTQSNSGSTGSSELVQIRNKKKHLHDDLNLAMGNLINYFNQFQKYYCNYLDEQVNVAKQQQGMGMNSGYGAGANTNAYAGSSQSKSAADQGTLKMVNDTIVRSFQNIKFMLHSLSEACIKATSSQGSRQSQVLLQSILLSQVCEDILKLKTELQNAATSFRKKSNTLKENRMILSYEAKSNNLIVLRDETLTSLHSLVGKLDTTQQVLVQARSLFTLKIDDSTAVFNMQLPRQNPALLQASTLVQSLNKVALANSQKGIPFEEQVAITRKLEQQEKQIFNLQGSLTQVRKENYLLKESTRSSDNQTSKLQATIQILKTQLKKSQQSLQDVSNFGGMSSQGGGMQDFDKSVISQSDCTMSTQVSSNIGSSQPQSSSAINNQNQAQAPLPQKDDTMQKWLQQQSAQLESQKKSAAKTQDDSPHLFQMDHVTSLLQTESTKEDFYLFGDVFTGLQKWSLQTKLAAGQRVTPLNDLVAGSDRQKLQLLQEKSLHKICQMAHKMESINRLSKGSSLQVMEKDREWKEKFDKMQSEKEFTTQDLERKLESAETEKMIIKKNYESQLNMMSEQLVELNLQNERFKGN